MVDGDEDEGTGDGSSGEGMGESSDDTWRQVRQVVQDTAEEDSSGCPAISNMDPSGRESGDGEPCIGGLRCASDAAAGIDGMARRALVVCDSFDCDSDGDGIDTGSMEDPDQSIDALGDESLQADRRWGVASFEHLRSMQRRRSNSTTDG